MSIVVVGSINTDLTIRVPHIAAVHETVLGVGGFVTTQGGKGANQAVAAAAGGLPISMVGRVGQDDFGEAAIADLVAAGIDCRYVVRDENFSTGLATIFVDPEGNNSITVASGANAQVGVSDVKAAADLIASASVVMLQLEIPMLTVQETIRIANKHNTLVLLDPAPVTQNLLDLTGIDCLTPNEVEAEALVAIAATDDGGPQRIIAELMNRGAKQVALTLGASGCYISGINSGVNKVVRISAQQVKSVDSTGAGDAFNGFLATGLARGMSLEEAAHRACCAATQSVLAIGARGKLPSWREVDELLRV